MNDQKVRDQLLANYKGYYSDGISEWRRIGAVAKVENIVELCRSLQKERVLEIGAGEGSILNRLSEIEFGESLFAVEISETGVETILRRRINRLVECRKFDGYSVPYSDNYFDLAILSHVVEHVEHPRQLLYEASRVARFVFVEVPLEDNVRLSSEFVFDEVGHINYFGPKTLRRLVQSCNLRVLRQITTNPSKEIHSYGGGRKGIVNFYIKEFALKVMPSIAPRIFTYHGALLCETLDT